MSKQNNISVSVSKADTICTEYNTFKIPLIFLIGKQLLQSHDTKKKKVSHMTSNVSTK